jgi:copper chaperone CopZ
MYYRAGWILLVSALCLGCAESNTTSHAVTAVAFNADGAPTVEFDVPDMMCEESCAAKVRELLGEQAGVKEVVVDFPAKTAIVAIEEEKFNADAAIAVLVDHGFELSKQKSSD